jgi:hypothetical protein
MSSKWRFGRTGRQPRAFHGTGRLPRHRTADGAREIADALVGRVLAEALSELHPYESFELVAFGVQDGAPAYLDRISGSVSLPS